MRGLVGCGFLLACVLTGMVWSWLSFLLERQSIRIAFRAMLYPKFWLTALLFFALTALFSFLTGHLLAGGLLGGLPFLLLGLVSSYKTAIVGSPLTLNDLALAGNLGAIISLNIRSLLPSRNTVLALVGILLWSLVLWFFSRPLALPSRKRALLAAAAPLALLVGVFWLALDPLVLTPLGRPLSMGYLSQSLVEPATGFPIGMLRAVRMRTRYVRPVSDAQLSAMLTQAEEELPAQPAGERHPNVILILSESFFDVTELPGVTFDDDPLADFHALQEEGVSGHFYTRSLGYGTCNIELEILTGVNTHLIYDEELATMKPELLSRVPAVPQLLKEVGYRTVMLHLYSDSIYHREPRMEAIGFDQRYFSDGFAAIDPEAAAAEDYWEYLSGHISGSYYSDDYMTDLLIDLFERSDQDGPMFAYAVSMENHTPYDAGKYDDRTISCSAPLEPDALEALTVVSQGCANASQALGRLADYFRGREEPTVILFFGDHRPGLSDFGESSVYDQLDAAAGRSTDYYDPQRIADQRSTSYLIWANDPTLLPAPQGTVEDAGSNYFGLKVLDAAGAGKPLYWRMLQQLSGTRLMDTTEYALGVDHAAALISPTRGEDYQRLSRFGAILRKTLYGENSYSQRLWS